MKATGLIVFMVCIAATAGLFATAGINDIWGVSPDTSQAEEATEELNDGFSTFSATQTSETYLTDIFLVTAILNTVMNSFEMLTTLPSILINLGIPEWIVTFIMAPLGIMLGFLFIYVAIGRDITR